MTTSLDHVQEAAVLHEVHEREFACLEPWLRDFYAGYANRDKLIALLNCWTFAHRCFLETYGKTVTEAFSKLGGSHMRYAWLVDFNADITLGRPPQAARAWAELGARLLPVAYLPGANARTWFRRLAYRASRLMAQAMPCRMRRERKALFVQRLAAWLGEADQPLHAACLETALPDVFTADQVSVGRSAGLTLDGSAHALLDFYGYENLLLLDRYVRLRGRQHGGGYDIFRNDPWVRYEQALCDTFIGWGHSAVNERQHKYLRRDSRARSTRADGRIVIIERPVYPRIMQPMSPPVYSQFTNWRAVDYIWNEVQGARWEVCSLPYPGALRAPNYDGKRGRELQVAAGKGEKAIQGNDIVIFDCCAASLIHFCIEQEMTFILVIAQSDLEQFSASHRAWVDLLRAERLVFFDDERGRLSERLAALVAAHAELPARVAAYHTRHFIELS